MYSHVCPFILSSSLDCFISSLPHTHPHSLLFFPLPLLSTFPPLYTLPGVKLLKEFKAKYAEYEQKRQELTNAEKLFDLPITGYPHLLEVEKELKNLSHVFELYEAQRVSKGSFRCIYIYPIYTHVQYLELEIIYVDIYVHTYSRYI